MTGARFCHQCGVALKGGSRFCHGCGAQIGEANEEARQEPPSEATSGDTREWPLAQAMQLLYHLRIPAAAGACAAVAAFVLSWIAIQVMLRAVDSVVPASSMSRGDRATVDLVLSNLNTLSSQLARLNLATWLLAPLEGAVTGNAIGHLNGAAASLQLRIVAPTLLGILLAMLPCGVAAFMLARRVRREAQPSALGEGCVFAAAFAIAIVAIVASGPIDTGIVALGTFGQASASLSVPPVSLAINAFIVGAVGFVAGILLWRGPESTTGAQLRQRISALPGGLRAGLAALLTNLVVVLVALLCLIIAGIVYRHAQQPLTNEADSAVLARALAVSPVVSVNAAPAAFLALSGGVVSSRAAVGGLERGNRWGFTWNSIQGLLADSDYGAYYRYDQVTVWSTLVALVLSLILAPALVRAGVKIARHDLRAMWRQALLATFTYLVGCYLLAQVGSAQASVVAAGDLGRLSASVPIASLFVGVDYFASIPGIWLPTAAWITLGVAVGAWRRQSVRGASQEELRVPVLG